MGTTKLFKRGLLALGLVALLSSYGLAAAGAPSANGPTATAVQAPGITGQQNVNLVRASNVMHTKIKSPQGETLGQVFDIVLAPNCRAVSYVALSQGGILGIGNTLYAVPWSALRESVDGSYVVPVTKQQLDRSRGFSRSNWPTGPSKGWTTENQAYLYGGPAFEAGGVQARRFSRLKETDVRGSQGANAGNIQDFVIAMDSGRIVYTIVSYGGILGLGQEFAAIPQNAITLVPGLERARIDTTKAVVQANSFRPGHWPDLSSSSYSRQLAETFGVQPVGTALAFVPPAESKATAGAASPAAAAAPAAQPTAAELMGTFNPSDITTLDGTVIDQGKFPAASGAEMLWLRVRLGSGRTVLVNLGPRDYISTQDFYIVPGDRIHLTGSEVSANAPGKEVFLATRVAYGTYALRLRSNNGTPLWQAETANKPGEASELNRP